MEEFEFENGCCLKDVQIEYYTTGTPEYDEEGHIVNAVIYCHRFNGSYASINEVSRFIGDGEVFDKNKYFIISATSLGFPESCSPSTTGLKHNFPTYTVKDRVNFKRQFLADKFNIVKVHGVVGRGVGGYEAYTWACDYPEEMDFIVIVNSSYKTNGYRYVVSKCIESIIETSDNFYDDVYSDSLSRVMISLNKLLYSNYFSKRIFQDMTNDEIDVVMDDFVDEGLFTDIYDFKARNDCIINYNVEDKLKNIQAKALIISSSDDLYYSPDYDTVPLKNFIDDAKIVIVESKRDYNDVEDYYLVNDDLVEFMDELKKE